MKLRYLLIGALLATSLSGPALAGEDDTTAPSRRHVKFVRHIGPTVEHAAMQNILVDALSAKTGRSAGEIKKLLEASPPPEVARQLGLGESDMKALFKESRQTLIQRAAAAGLITAEQAQELRAAPVPGRLGPPPGDLPPDVDG